MVKPTVIAATVWLKTQTHTDLWWEAGPFVQTGQVKIGPKMPNSTSTHSSFQEEKAPTSNGHRLLPVTLQAHPKAHQDPHRPTEPE